MELDEQTQKRLAKRYAEGLLSPETAKDVDDAIASGKMKPINDLIYEDMPWWAEAIDRTRYVSEPILHSREKLFRGVENLGREGLTAIGILDRADTDKWKDETAKDLKRRENMQYTQGIIPSTIEFGTDVAPWVGGGLLGGAGKLGALLWGMAGGATQFDEDPGLWEVAKNTGVGGVLGLGMYGGAKALPHLWSGAKNTVSYIDDWLHGRKPAIQKNALRGIDAQDFNQWKDRSGKYNEALVKQEQQKILEAAKAADELGTPITPAEAAPKSALTGKAFGDTARSRKGGAAMAGKFADRQKGERKVIEELQERLGPETDLGIDERNASRILNESIEQFDDASKKRVSPLYEPLKEVEANKGIMQTKKIVDDAGREQAMFSGGLLKKDPLLRKHYEKFMTTPEYQRAVQVEKIKPKSYAMMDKFKQYLDEVEGTLTKDTGGSYKRGFRGGQMTQAKQSFRDKLDKQLDEYPKIRDAAQKEIQLRQQYKDGPIGRFADIKLKDATKFTDELFSPSKTTAKSRAEVKRVLDAVDPNLYKRMRGQHFRNVLGDIDFNDKNAATEVYRKLLKDKDQYEMLLTELADDPKGRQMVMNMKKAYAGIMNAEKANTAAHTSKKYLDDPRNFGTKALNYLQRKFGSNFEEKAQEYMFSTDWIEDVVPRWQRGNVTKKQADAIEKFIGMVGLDKPAVIAPTVRQATEKEQGDYVPKDYDETVRRLQEQGR